MSTIDTHDASLGTRDHKCDYCEKNHAHTPLVKLASRPAREEQVCDDHYQVLEAAGMVIID
jgi:hypothetical protein